MPFSDDVRSARIGSVERCASTRPPGDGHRPDPDTSNGAGPGRNRRHDRAAAMRDPLATPVDPAPPDAGVEGP
jgi:hypothetical protein